MVDDLEKRDSSNVNAAENKAHIMTCVVIACGSQGEAGSKRKAAMNAGKKISAGRAVFSANIRHHLLFRTKLLGLGAWRIAANIGVLINMSKAPSISITNPMSPMPVPNSFQYQI